MASSDRTNKSDFERKQLLEEIRKRAEEAELKRIEAQEHKAVSNKAQAPPQGAPPSSSAVSPRDQAVKELRERISVALDRGKVEKANDLLNDLMTLAPDDPEIDDFKTAITELEEEQQSSKARRRSVDTKSREEAAQTRARREKNQKKISEFYESAYSFYQQEKYDKGLKNIQELLALDPAHEEATLLADKIEKARMLAERVKAEEARRKAEEAASAPPPQRQAPVPEQGDPWGPTAAAPKHDDGLDIPAEEPSAIVPQKPALIDRIAEKILRIRIPVKPLITTLLIGAIGVAAFFVVDEIRNAVSPPKYTLLVFPLTNTAADNSIDYLAEGISEDLIRDLSSVKDLHVIAASSAFHFGNSYGNLIHTAQTVGANYFLDWSISKSGDAWALQTTFSDTTSTKPLFTSRQKASMAELPAIRLRLARMLTDTMQIALNMQEVASLKRKMTTTADAYDEYLKGRFMLRHADLYPIASAVDAFERSLQLDDGFPDALAGQAWALALAYEAAAETDNVLLAKASACVQRAMALGLTTPETFRILGMVEQFQGEYDRALEHLENAVKIGPSDAESQRRLSVVYVIKGRGDDALKAAQHAMANDPRNVSSYDILGLIQQYRGDYKAALQSYELGSRLASDRSEYRSGQYADVLVFTQQADLAGEILRDRVAQLRNSYVEHYRLGRILQSQGVPIQQWQDVFRQSEELILARLKENPSDGVALSYDALVHTRVGRFKEAATAINGALQIDSTNIDILYNASRMYALQRNKEKALAYLLKAIKRRYRLESILDLDFFNLRSDQGYLRTIVR